MFETISRSASIFYEKALLSQRPIAFFSLLRYNVQKRRAVSKIVRLGEHVEEEREGE